MEAKQPEGSHEHKAALTHIAGEGGKEPLGDGVLQGLSDGLNHSRDLPYVIEVSLPLRPGTGFHGIAGPTS